MTDMEQTQATDSIILFHGNCPDGFTGAWVLDKFLRTTGTIPDLCSCKYEAEPPDVTGKAVFMVDFCYDDHDKMRKLIKDSSSFLLLDHHKTAASLIEPEVIKTLPIEDAERFCVYDNIAELGWRLGFGIIPNPGEVHIVVDQSHSGAMLAAIYAKFLRNEPWSDEIPGDPYEFIYYVEDRDLWHHALPDTHAVTAAITSHPYELPEWDQLYHTPLNETIIEGEAIERYRQQLIASHVSYAQPITIAGHKMMGSPAPYAIGSDVAHELALKSDNKMACYWVDQPGFRKFGLRSLEDGPDVAAICEHFGGGGHTHAAGFAVKYKMESLA